MIITMTRVEGASHECDKPKTATSFLEATRHLQHWSHTAPKNGGYDKIDFKIKDDESGVIYVGRYDLKHWHTETANLRAHVNGCLEYTRDDEKAHSDLRERAQELIEFFKDAP